MSINKVLVFSALLTVGSVSCDSTRPSVDQHPIAGSAMGGAGAIGPVGGAGAPTTPAAAMDAAVSDAVTWRAP